MFSLFLNFKERVAQNLLGLSWISLSLEMLKRNSRNSFFLISNSENAIIRSSRSIKFSRNLRLERRKIFRNQQHLKRLAMTGERSRFCATRLKYMETGKNKDVKTHPNKGWHPAFGKACGLQCTTIHTGAQSGNTNIILELLPAFDPNCIPCPSAAAVRVSCPNGTARSPSQLNFRRHLSDNVQLAASALHATSPCGNVVRNWVWALKAEDARQIKIKVKICMNTRIPIIYLTNTFHHYLKESK